MSGYAFEYIGTGSFYRTKLDLNSISGTQYRIPRFATTSTLENSNIYTNSAGTMVCIGSSYPVSFLELRRPSDDSTHWLSLTCEGLTHGISTVLPTSAFFSIDTQDTTKGGATIMGATAENDRNPIMLLGILGSVSGLGQTSSAIKIRGAGQSGTTVTDIAATKPVIDFNNNNTLLGRFLGNGNYSILGSITIGTIASLGSSATTYLTHTGGLIQSRTASQLLSDIGASPSLSGTQYTIPRFATTTTLGDSGIYTDSTGTMVGINFPSPTHTFQVRNISTDSWLDIEMEVDGTDYYNVNYYSISSVSTKYTRHQFYTRYGTATDNLSMYIDYDGTVFIQGGYLWIRNKIDGSNASIILQSYNTAIAATTIISSIDFMSNDLSTYGSGNCAFIRARAEADFDGSGRPTYLSFCTSGNDNSGPIERLKIGSSGTLNYINAANEGTTSSKILTLDSSNNIDFRTPAELIVDMGGVVTGVGTDNYLLKYTNGATGVVGNSNIVDDGNSLRLLKYTYIDSNSTNENPRGMTIDLEASYTTNKTNINITPLYLVSSIIIDTGISITGGMHGQLIAATRATSTDNGTLDSIIGLEVVYGHSSASTGSTATTTSAYGIRIRPYHNINTTTITNSYGLRIEIPDTTPSGATVTNKYPIYSAWNEKSYLAGGIQVDGTITCATITHATSISLTSPKVYIGSRTMETDEGGRAILYTAGENLAKGEVVCFLQGGTGGRVYKCPTSGNSADMPIGIVYADATTGNSIWIVCSGRAEVLPESGITLTMGYVCSVSTSTSGRVTQENTPSTVQHWRECGHPEANGSGNGALTFINVHFN
jgi:hypothetical protein